MAFSDSVEFSQRRCTVHQPQIRKKKCYKCKQYTVDLVEQYSDIHAQRSLLCHNVQFSSAQTLCGCLNLLSPRREGYLTN